MTENLFDWYCDYLTPKGPHGKTAEDVQAIADKSAGDGYAAMKELIAYKRGLELKRDTESFI